MYRSFVFAVLAILLLTGQAFATPLTFSFSSQSFRVNDGAVVAGSAVGVGWDTATILPYRYTESGGMMLATQLGLPTGAIGAAAYAVDSTGAITGQAFYAGGVSRMVSWNSLGTPTVVNPYYGSTSMFGSAVSGGNQFGIEGGAPVRAQFGGTTAAPLQRPTPSQYAITDAQTAAGTTVVVGTAIGTNILPYWTGSGSSFAMNSILCPGSICEFNSLDQTTRYAGVSVDGEAGYYDFLTGTYTMFGILGTPDAMVLTGTGLFVAINGFENDVYGRAPDGTIDSFALVWNALNPGAPISTGITRVTSLNLYGSEFYMTGIGSPLAAVGTNPWGVPNSGEVPEPGSFFLLASGAALLALGRKCLGAKSG
jgi:hypothetical protein